MLLNDEIFGNNSDLCKIPISSELKYIDMNDNVYSEPADGSKLMEGDLLLADVAS